MATFNGEPRIDVAWPAEGVARVPYRVFFDPAIYALEQERLFRGPVWNYVALEAEVRNPGDFKPPSWARPRSSSTAARMAG
jgi:hypothetical protein